MIKDKGAHSVIAVPVEASASRKRPIDQMSAEEPAAAAEISMEEEIEKLRQELRQTKAALAMYQLSGAAAQQTPLPLPSAAAPPAFPLLSLAALAPEQQLKLLQQPAAALGSVLSAALPRLEPAAQPSTATAPSTVPLAQTSTPALANALHLPLLQQLLQNQAAAGLGAGPIMLLPQATGTLAGLGGPALNLNQLGTLAQLTPNVSRN